MVDRESSMWLCGDDVFFFLVFLTQIAVSGTDHLRITCHPDYYHWPLCIDYPDGYGCECGPGYLWNTEMCVASGLDSRLDFSETDPLRYTLLKNKPFPSLTSFTVALWLKIYRSNHPGTVLSYSMGDKHNILRISSGPSLRMKIHDEEINTQFMMNVTQWVHFAWTWTSTDGSWRVYINGGRLVLKGRASRADKPIPPGGELVLGQVARTPETKNSFDATYAFLGEMGYVNIWHEVMTRQKIKLVYEDCKLMRCGDAVEWADFRTGTHGIDMRIRWPSMVFGATPTGSCFSEKEAGQTCDKYCSHVIGAQCNEEIVENIHWKRTPADQNASVACPGLEPEEGSNLTALFDEYEVTSKAYAFRQCFRTPQNEGIWSDPLLDDCVSPKELKLKTTISHYVENRKENLSEDEILRLLLQVQNQTLGVYYRNPIDIATVIDSLQLLVAAQRNAIDGIWTRRGQQPFGLDRDRDKHLYPSFNDSVRFSKAITRVIDHLVVERNDVGWLATEPQGSEGSELFTLIDDFVGLLTKSLQFHIGRGDISHEGAVISALNRRVAFHIETYKVSDSLPSIIYPKPSDSEFVKSVDNRGSITLSQDALLSLNISTLPEYITISTAFYNVPNVLPNHNIKPSKKKGKDKDDNINSVFYSVVIHLDDQRLNNLSVPIVVILPYLDNFNISNAECVNLDRGNDTSARWHWSRESCRLVTHTVRDIQNAVCHCYKPGIFGVITDMYDVNWDKGEEPIILMEIPSYIGCSISALLCLTSFILLVYFRTSTKTAALHKNFALANFGGQIVFMFGIDRLEHEMLCQVSAIAFHYFFLATFSWLMNEAFNLYIVITYAAHSHGEHTEGGSQWRYYILGWMLPGVLVGALIGAHTDDYYAEEMCWIAWKYLWLFLGPAIGIISVTVLVLIFTAKEHNESSYSKNEKTNKMIIIYSKALWTQVILILLQWSFAILSIKMRGIIIKYLFALFNGLQGSFFFVFYFLLHDEIRAIFQVQAKKKNLEKQGYEYSPTSSMDDLAFTQEMMDVEPQLPEPSSTTTLRSRKQLNGTETRQKRTKANIEASSSEGEGSDCEMMVTTV